MSVVSHEQRRRAAGTRGASQSARTRRDRRIAVLLAAGGALLACLWAFEVSTGGVAYLVQSWRTARLPAEEVMPVYEAQGERQVLTQALPWGALTAGYGLQPSSRSELQVVGAYIARDNRMIVARGIVLNSTDRGAQDIHLFIAFRDISGRVVDSDELKLERVSAHAQRDWYLAVGEHPSIVRADVRAEWVWAPAD